MSAKQTQSSSKGLKTLFIAVLILIFGAIAYRFWTTHQKAPPGVPLPVKVSRPKITPLPSIMPEPSQAMKPGTASEPSVVSQPGVIVPQPSIVSYPTPTKAPEIIDFDKLGKDKALQARMDKRKKAYGAEKGIDMVVKTNETIKVGDVIVPMREIEEQIRLNRGELVESDIPSHQDLALTPEARKRLLAQIDQREKRFFELERQLKERSTSENLTGHQAAGTEYQKLKRTVQMAKTYRQIVADLEKENAAAEQSSVNKKDQFKDTLTALQKQKNELEKALQIHMAPEKLSASKTEEYGIYIVRPGDNIWNIHFRFLNGCFEKKGVTISPLADEPIANGVSSGVGKLLKFSENMVYLYNLEKRKLDINLNQLTPFKKIVIYNMNRVFELLDQIDYQSVNRIHFDGESIWIIQD